MNKELEARFSSIDAKLAEILAATKVLEKIMYAVVQQLKAEAQSKHHLYPENFYHGSGIYSILPKIEAKPKTCG